MLYVLLVAYVVAGLWVARALKRRWPELTADDEIMTGMLWWIYGWTLLGRKNG